jgi:hypothetical protein
MLQRMVYGGAVFLAGTALAHATLINGTSLQNELDSRTLDGSFQNVNTAQVPADDLWTLASIGNGTVMMMFELAGNANTNMMGLYDPYNPSNTLQLFSGPDSLGTKIGIMASNTTPGLLGTCLYSGWGCSFTGNTIQLGADGHFGFYLDTPNGRFYSDNKLNTDKAADGTSDHLVAFAGDGSDQLDPLKDGNYGVFAQGEYVIAWEGGLLSNSDRDYNDMVVLTESVVPVPEPGMLALFGGALLAFGLVKMRRPAGKSEA